MCLTALILSFPFPTTCNLLSTILQLLQIVWQLSRLNVRNCYGRELMSSTNPVDESTERNEEFWRWQIGWGNFPLLQYVFDKQYCQQCFLYPPITQAINLVNGE